MTDPITEADTHQAPTAEVSPPTAADPVAATLAELSKPFASPIPGPEPGGENARYDELHEAIRNEVDKLGRPEGEQVNWDLIRDSGRTLLTEKSKDYLIAGYFAVAAYVRGGPRGLIEGIAAISALLEHYWDNGFPPVNRVRARINAIDWFVERVGALREQAPNEVQPGDFQLLSHAAKKLEALVLERFQDDIPNIYGLKDTLERIELSIADAAGSQPQASAEPSGTMPTPTTQAASLPPSAAPSGSAAEKLAQIAAPFVSPIPGASRSGENARYDAKHEAIRNEVDKLGKPIAEPVSWTFVRDTGREVLTTKSKDFLIASYFAVASYLEEGPRGLVTGVSALSALLRNYWDDGYPPPKRIRARINAIDWFIDRVNSLGDLAPKAGDQNDLELLSAAAKELEALVLERFQDDIPNIYGLKDTLQRIELLIAKQAPPQSSQQQAPAQAQPLSAQAGAPQAQQSRSAAPVQLATPTSELADPAEVNKFLKQVGESLYKASRVIFKASKEDPVAYRLCRQGLYMQLQGAPPATEGNKTMVPAPPPERESQLNALLSANNWAVLLDEAESGLPSVRFWLDAHRYVALALGGLGYENARDAVVAETAGLVQRCPELLERTFDDGRPFASAATREWLNAVSPSGGGTAGGPAFDDAEGGALEEGLAEAHKLAVGGKLDDAIEKLSLLVRSDAIAGRDRFRAKLAMADACSSAGAVALAEGILAGLTAEIEQFGLEVWEPKMAEACYRARYEALAAMAGESTKSRDELVDVYRRLCGVAPASALKLGKPPG